MENNSVYFYKLDQSEDLLKYKYVSQENRKLNLKILVKMQDTQS